MPGKDLDAVRKLEQPAERVKEPFRAFLRGDCQIRPRCVADEERVTGEHEPGLVGTGAIDDDEAACARAGARVCGSRASTTWPSSSSTPSSSASCGYAASAAPWIDTGMPCSSASRPWPERWSACVCVSIVRTIFTPCLGGRLSTGSIAYGGSTNAATPASSSPTRYDAQPRSSSRNCWNSTRHDAITLRPAAGEAQRGERECQREQRAAGDDGPGKRRRLRRGHHVEGCSLTSSGLTAGVDGPQDQGHLARRASVARMRTVQTVSDPFFP